MLGVDLTAGRYLNLHQCVYYNSFTRDHFTVVVPIDTDFSAGTNVSNTPDTAPSCADGNGIFQLIPLLSGVKALDQNTGRYVNLQQCVLLGLARRPFHDGGAEPRRPVRDRHEHLEHPEQYAELRQR
ncbi:hypothetical protein LT493_04400 [Streptomyces tricolor]|nr:hypothetical protein [Streptomyces tricolor]